MAPMPDTRKHRGAHPRDARLFAPGRLADLRSAVGDLSWLLSRGYAWPSSVKIVGDRYALTVRQRAAVERSACSDAALAGRLAKRVPPEMLAGAEVAIDGYNLLISVEAALSGGVILGGRDSSFRDLAGVHGSYRTMAETIPALDLIGRHLAERGTARVQWWLDAPVSNSGRLRERMLEQAGRNDWNWSVELSPDPDKALIQTDRVVVTSDSVVLDGCRVWANLARHLIETHIAEAWVVDLADPPQG